MWVVLSITSCLALKTGTTLTTLPLKLFMHRYTRFQFCFLICSDFWICFDWPEKTRTALKWIYSELHIVAWMGFYILNCGHPLVFEHLKYEAQCVQFATLNSTNWVLKMFGFLRVNKHFGEFRYSNTFSDIQNDMWLKKNVQNYPVRWDITGPYGTIESCCVALFQQCCRRFAHSCRSLRRQKAVSNLWVK